MPCAVSSLRCGCINRSAGTLVLAGTPESRLGRVRAALIESEFETEPLGVRGAGVGNRNRGMGGDGGKRKPKKGLIKKLITATLSHTH